MILNLLSDGELSMKHHHLLDGGEYRVVLRRYAGTALPLLA